MDGFGNINWWGFSPCLDLIKLYKENCILNENEEALNILLVNAGDQRHILKSLASKKLLGKKKIVRFYVYEKMLELYARDLFLLSIAFEHPARTGLQEKTENFLEIFGNLYLREHTAQLIQSRANEFIKYITDLDYLSKSNLSMFDFSLLKFKERDFLEGIFKFWRIKETNKEYFAADKCWDLRLRTYFGNRYDSRTNAYDWDFAMKLNDRKNCSIINNKVYSKWRDTGLAFELRDSSYDRPNKTLASGAVFSDPRNGDKVSRRGYFGDIIIGPYITYGIESENADYFKKQNECYRYTAMDVARSNVNNLMEKVLELSSINLNKYRDKNLDNKISELKITEITEEEEEEEQKEEANLDYFKIEDCKIVFLPLTAFQDFTQKTKYDNYFDIVYFSNSGAAHMDKSFAKVLKENSLVVFETAKYMIEMSNEQIKGFTERIKQIGVENNFTDLNKYHTLDQQSQTKTVPVESLDYLKFKLNRKIL